MARKFFILLAAFAVLVAGYFVYRELRNAHIARRATELGKVLEEEIREWESRDRSRPPLFEPAVEGTAWEHYREAWRIHTDLDENSCELERLDEIDRALMNWEGLPTPLPKVAVPWVEHFEPALLAVRKGACTSRIGVADDLRMGGLTMDEEEDAPPSNAINVSLHLSDLLKHRAAVALGAGDTKAAVSWLLVRARLGADLASSGTSLHNLVGRTAAGQVRSDLARLIGGGRLPTGEVERAAGLPPPPRHGWATVEADCLRTQVDLMRIAQGHTGWREYVFDTETWYERLETAYVAPDRQEALDTWVRLRARFPEWRKAWPGEDDASLSGAANDIGRTLGGPSVLWQLSANGLQLSLQGTLNSRPGVDEQHEMLQLNIALFRYRQREGKDPETIEEIRPAGVRKTTSLGAWDWRKHEAAPRRWIERGTPADDVQRDRETNDLVRDLSESD